MRRTPGAVIGWSSRIAIVDIRELRQDTITDSEADEVVRLRNLVDPRRLRSDPPVSRQLAINELRPSVATVAFTYFGLFDGERLLGLAETSGAINAENADVCEVGLWTDPTADSQQLSAQLYAHVDAHERARGRTRYWGWGDMASDATRSFWEDQLGYTLAYEERISRCALPNVDAELMQQWLSQAANRAGGYHLVRAQAPFDDECIEYYAQALEAMNDAPIDDLVLENEVFDADRARQIESLHLGIRSSYQAVFAVETATGALAGFTAVRIPDAEPSLSHQGDTVTIDAHRKRGIGRWIKADMWTWLRTDRPDVLSLDTGNAESNRAMLSINEAMGFQDVLHHGVWHLPT